MAHVDGTIAASEVFPVAEACGLTPDQVRSVLRRLVDEGLFTREGRARDAQYRATARGLAALGTTQERQRLAYVQDHAGRGWDRRWRLVAVAKTSKPLASFLVTLGGATINPNLYVSPHR